MSGTATATAAVVAKSIDQRTIKVYGTVTFADGSGHTDYASGGLVCDLSPAGVAPFGVAVPGNPVEVYFTSFQGALYSYDPVAKKVKNYSAVNTEHTASAASDFASDVPTFCATYVR